jgi:2-methylisocitrate lyase-like PEP mutase family enzyme
MELLGVSDPHASILPVSTDVILAPSKRWISRDSPGGRILARIDDDLQEVFYGACTPFRNILLEKLNHHSSWISSFELASLLGEKDDESLSFDALQFFFDRILKKCPKMNLFVDCGAGWTDEPNELRRIFAAFSSKAALVSIQNDLIGHKDNSFLDRSLSAIESPATIARKLQIVAEVCKDVLIVLRLENNIHGQSMQNIVEYLTELKKLSAPFDLVLFHHKISNIDQMIEFSLAFYDLFTPDIKLAAIPTAYIEAENLFERLHTAHYNVVVIPNYAVRYEYDALLKAYQLLISQDVVTVNRHCSPMQKVIDLIYTKEREDSVE